MEDTENKQYLTKSLFIKTLSCPTKMYYAKHREYVDKQRGGDLNQYLQEAGYLIEALARLYYPNGRDLNMYDRDSAIEMAADLITEDQVILYGAPIVYDKFLAQVDILVKQGNNIDLIEVKSKTFDPTTDSLLTKSGSVSSKWKNYVYDVAFQTKVLKLKFPDFTITPYLLVVDKSKVATVDGLHQLISIDRDEKDNIEITYSKSNIEEQELGEKILISLPMMDLVKQIWEEEATFVADLEMYASYVHEDKKFAITIGAKCKSCEYRLNRKVDPAFEKNGFNECWIESLGWTETDFAKAHIFDIWRISTATITKLLESSVYFIDDVRLPVHDFNERQQLQIQKTRLLEQGEEAEFIDPELFQTLDNISYPVHFIDFETVQTVIPFFKNDKPYKQLVFQFSILTLEQDGTLTHKEWLEPNPTRLLHYHFVKALKQQLSQDAGTIFHYSFFEKTVLKKLKLELIEQQDQLPADTNDLLDWLDTITNDSSRMFDMLKLIQKYYYHPLMKGSNSLKNVIYAVINASTFLQTKYSSNSDPYVSSNFPEGMIWYQVDETSGKAKDPYNLLISQTQRNEGNIIKQGTGAISAYIKLQNPSLTQSMKENIINSLLKYCELDTLSMVMIFEHWQSFKPKEV